MAHPEGFNPATERKFRVGQFVRVNDPKSTVNGCAARIISVSNGWRVAEHALGTGLFDASSLEPWTPRTAERVRITKHVTPELVGLILEFEFGDPAGEWIGVCRDDATLGGELNGEELGFGPPTEFEPAFEEPATTSATVDVSGPPVATNKLKFTVEKWPYPIYDSALETSGPDVRIKPNEALVREAERLMMRDVNGMRVALEVAAAERFRGVGAPKTTERTHYDRKPRAEREAGRTRMVMEVLTAPWKGRER